MEQELAELEVSIASYKLEDSPNSEETDGALREVLVAEAHRELDRFGHTS